MKHKWTEGEIRRYVADDEREAMREVLQYLCERGPGVVAWGDMSDPEAEENARRERELREADAADGIF